MSKLFSAIAQSEQNYQTQSTLTMPTYAQQQATPVSRRGWSSIVLFTLPVVAVVGYTLLQPYISTAGQQSAELHTTEARTTTLARIDNAQQELDGQEETAMAERVYAQHDVLPEVSFLPYPELITEALPEANWDQSQALVTNNTADTYGGSEVKVTPNAPKVISAKPSSRQDDSWNLDKLDLSGLSPELASQLQSAIAATDSTEGSADFAAQSQQALTQNGAAPNASNTTVSTSTTRAANAVMAIGDLPAAVQQRLPTMNLQAHIYSSNAQSRWVKVNDREIFEGDAIAPGVTLRSIEPRQIVFDFENYRIAMPALSEW